MWRETAIHRSGRRGHLFVACWLLVSVLTASAAAPGIELTNVPAYGTSGLLYGRVSGANPSDYGVAVYIDVPPYGWANGVYEHAIRRKKPSLLHSDGIELTTHAANEDSKTPPHTAWQAVL
jgi:hypothetical protein